MVASMYGTLARIDWVNVVAQYGADPLGVADSTTAFQNAIAQLQPGGGVIYFPAGNYKLDTGAIVINVSGAVIRVVGDGKYATFLNFYNNGNGSCIRLYNSTSGGGGQWGGGFSDLTIDGTHVPTSLSFTATNASPAVFTVTGNTFGVGLPVQLQGGSVPQGFLGANLTGVSATHASPAVFTATASNLTAGLPVQLSGSSLPGGFIPGFTYYVASSPAPTANTFSLAATVGGTAINSSSSGSSITVSPGALYVINRLGNTFNLAATAGGAGLNSAGTGSGTVVPFACGVSYGDNGGGLFENMSIQNFTATWIGSYTSTLLGAAGFYFVNSAWWCEGTRIDAMHLNNVTSGIVFDGTSGRDFGYTTIGVHKITSNGDGIVAFAGGWVYHSDLQMQGNLNATSSPNTFAAVRVVGAGNANGTSPSRIENKLTMMVESDQSGGNIYSPATVVLGPTNSIRYTFGGFDFADSSAFVAAVLTPGCLFDFHGPVIGDNTLLPNGMSYNSPWLCPPVAWAPSATTYTTASATMSAVSSGNASTGTFTAPQSGNVVVQATLIFGSSATADAVSFGLCATGTVTPMIGYTPAWKEPAAALPFMRTLSFLVTGLTPGTSYSYDLMFAIAGAGTLTVYAANTASTTPTGGSLGGPILMTVTAA